MIDMGISHWCISRIFTDVSEVLIDYSGMRCQARGRACESSDEAVLLGRKDRPELQTGEALRGNSAPFTSKHSQATPKAFLDYHTTRYILILQFLSVKGWKSSRLSQPGFSGSFYTKVRRAEQYHILASTWFFDTQVCPPI